MKKTKSSAAKLAKSRVMVVDDHPVVRQGLAMLINQQPDLMLCGEAESGDQAMEVIPVAQPQIVMVDISLRGRDGIELIKRIKASHRRLPVLVLSMRDETLYAERALRAGARGYIMKQEATDKVLLAIHRVLRGEVYLSEEMSERMLQRLAEGNQGDTSPIKLLSDRELEVFGMIGRGRNSRHIALELKLSVKTVESYLARIKEKLRLSNAAELLQQAVQWVQNGSAS